MTNNADAQIAREWASKALDNDLLNEVPIEGYRAAARHILATTTPPTMADVDWDDAVHAGLCAEHEEHGLVRMLYADGEEIDCILPDMSLLMIRAENLTPLPGTRLDLTPRRQDSDGVSDGAPSTRDGSVPRPEDVPVGEVWEVECHGERYVGLRNAPDDINTWWLIKIDAIGELWVRDSEVTLLHRLASESTPDHPTELTTEADYRNAPTGTVVAAEDGEAWTKGKDGLWETYGIISGYNNYAMSDEARQVLRWGETL